ncbi:SMC family ATPase [Phormidium sp. CCY1219]|uniref:SMC family ATPase n=1 Tax=Phormidium sp. CCY1219 TaxID=2886104 RepID=UPI002D1F8C9C|nr:SMC family ATPase [Phormidium sp. CCY1219]MEB3830884.1 SMC family ATPase [Phormidium sp. CCY1219]
MRPLELSLAGFTSFRREQTLNFSELDLFAITGATGAGKSSLLDAITYALYGTTARTSQVSELVSQGASELKVQFRFSVSRGEFRVTRRWRYRPSSPVTQVLLEQALSDRSWETLETKERETKKAIAEILGMDFHTFTRVILLPQGQFDEFLKGNTSKRREILRQLAGFEIFERMRKETNDLARMLKQEVATIERQIADLAVPDEVEVRETRSQLTELEAGLNALNAEVFNAQKLLDEEERLFQQITRLSQLQQQLQELNRQSGEIESLQTRLAQSQRADRLQAEWAFVREAREQAHLTETAAREASARLAQAASQRAAAEENLAKVRAEAEAIAPQIAAREAALATAKVYEAQRQQLEREVAIATSSLQQKQRQQQAAKHQLTQASAKLKFATMQLQSATDALQRHQPGGERLDRLTTVAPLLGEWAMVEKQLKQQGKALDSAVREKYNQEEEYRAAILNRERAETAIAAIRQQLEAAENANAEAARANHAAALRMTLQPGDTCPVCGGLHPETEAELPSLAAFDIIDTVPLRQEEARAAQALQRAQLSATKAEAALENIAQKESETRAQLESTQQQQDRLRQQIAAALQLPASAAIDAIALQQEREALQHSDRQYRAAADAQKQAVSQLESAQQAQEFATQTHTAAVTESEAATAELARRQHNLQAARDKLHEITEGQSYEALAQALSRQKQTLRDRAEAAENAARSVQTNEIQLREQTHQATTAADTARDKKEQLNARWKETLKGADFTEESFLEAIVSPAQQSQWQTAIAQYRETKVELSTRVNDLQEIIGDRTTDLTQLNQRRSAQKIAEGKLKAAQDKRVELSTWIQAAEQKQAQGKKLLAECETVTQNYEIYRTLAQNLKANEFQAYILEHLEAELVARATLLLKELTDARYALQMQGGEYWVEDNWNGGELRRVRTLSGGETFAASLSMAIALSEKLSMGAELGSLFLDEGFGTLDAETLESVTQILDSLRQQNRLIGVITHVKALGERLPNQVKVFKSPQGSRLEVEML